ncbi:hypothetical protein ACFW04_014272 [Cataglyphis niger]
MIDISDLVTFIRHADKVHQEHYKQPLTVRDILKISQYLEAVQGDLTDFSNESLSNSEIEQNSDSENIINNINEYLTNTAKPKTKRLRWIEKKKNDVLHKVSKVNCITRYVQAEQIKLRRNVLYVFFLQRLIEELLLSEIWPIIANL